MNKLGEKIKSLRAERGLSQAQLSEMSGLSATHLSLIENGKRYNPGAETLLFLADALEVTVDCLLDREGKPHKQDNDNVECMFTYHYIGFSGTKKTEGWGRVNGLIGKNEPITMKLIENMEKDQERALYEKYKITSCQVIVMGWNKLDG